MVNATKQVTARQRAREASLRYYELEKKREVAQVAYFATVDAVDRAYAQRDREIAAAQQRAEQAVAAVREDAHAAIRALAELEVPRREIQDRLGCSAAEVRAALGAQTSGELADDEPATDADTRASEVDTRPSEVNPAAAAEDTGEVSEASWEHGERAQAAADWVSA